MKLIQPSPSASSILTTPEGRRILETEILPKYLPQRRWFGSKARVVERCIVSEWLPLPPGSEETFLACVQVEYGDGTQETYLLPLAVGERTAHFDGSSIIAELEGNAVLYDALQNEGFRGELLRMMAAEDICSSPGSSSIAGVRGHDLDPAAASFASRVLGVEQSNSSMVFGGKIFVKVYRKLEEGMNPDVEILRYLSEGRGFEATPPFLGSIELRSPGREARVLALALELVPNKGDAWALAQAEVEQFYRRALESGLDPAAMRSRSLFGEIFDASPLETLVSTFHSRARQLGIRTAQLHVALARETHDPHFATEPFTAADFAHLAETNRSSIERLTKTLRDQREAVSGANAVLVEKVLEAAPALAQQADKVAGVTAGMMKIRTHGDYHLGQVLDTGADFMIIDFEGEPQRSLAERRRKQSPLRDVAGMLRSFHYAAHSGLMGAQGSGSQMARWAELWAAFVSRAFLDGWLETAAGACFLPAEGVSWRRLLEAFIMEKAIYEVLYELNNRPSWVGIPLSGIVRLTELNE